MAARTLILKGEHGPYRVAVDGSRVTIGEAPAISAEAIGGHVVGIGDDPRRLAWAVADEDVRWVFFDGEVYRFEAARPGTRRKTAAQGSLAAPMPATVVRVQAGPGTVVARGDVLIVLEAMKMELPVRAPSAGTVLAVHCQPGDLVQPGVSLIEIEGSGD